MNDVASRLIEVSPQNLTRQGRSKGTFNASIADDEPGLAQSLTDTDSVTFFTRRPVDIVPRSRHNKILHTLHGEASQKEDVCLSRCRITRTGFGNAEY